MTNLTELRLGYNNITDISALSSLTNLTKLGLFENAITNISALSGLTKMTAVRLRSNNITDISALSGLTNLTFLNFEQNQIENISALSSLTNMTAVRLKYNNITDISTFSGLTNLTELYLDTNIVTDISALAGLTNLRELSLAGNDVSDISALSGLTNLRNLDLRGNVLSDSSVMELVPALESSGATVLFDWRLRKGDFDIELVVLDDFTESQKRVLRYTARRWMVVIVEDLPDYEFAQGWSGQCGGHSVKIPSGERIDDLRIYVGKGAAGAHGTAGLHVLREETHLTAVGCMTFRLSHASLLITALHEIGHVLGFASEVWNEFGFYQNPPNGDAHFNGPLAIAAFDDAGGRDYKGVKVPLQKGGSHWSVSILEGELMSPYGGGTLSAITVQSLPISADVSQADDYTLPDASTGEVR